MVNSVGAYWLVAAVGILPLLLGFLLSSYMHELKGWSAFSNGLVLGFLSLFFTDLVNDSGSLGVGSGLFITTDQIVLAGLFFLGFSLFTLVASKYSRTTNTVSSIPVAYLVALGIGLHAFGEGMIVAVSLASNVPIEGLSSMLQGFGFALHKLLEGFTIGVFFGSRLRLKVALVCGFLASVPYLAGISLGLLASAAMFAYFFFAAGAGAVLFMILQLTRRLSIDRIDYRMMLGFLVGFLLVYFATLLHFTAVSG